jgi:pilus assembly protein Flp/PilA
VARTIGVTSAAGACLKGRCPVRPQRQIVIFIERNFRMKNQAFSSVVRFLRDEEGAAAVEYGLLAALIAVVIVVAVSSVGNRLCETFKAIATRLGGTVANCPAVLS